jgi:hypothetical protein
MAQSRCFSPVRGRAMRVTRLDGCGRPVYGDGSVGVSDGFVTIAFTANTDDGEEISVTNAAGNVCVREVPCPKFLGYSVEIEFCNADPSLFALLTGQDTVLDPDGVAVGFRVNSDVSGCNSGFALEVWTGVPGVACDPAGGNPDANPGGYLLLPYLQGGIFGDFTIENDAISFTITGASTKTGSGWGTGPYDVISGGPLATPIASGDHLHVQYTDVAPPPAECGTIPLLDPVGAALTGVTTVVTALSVDFTPTPVGSDAWYVDFGDGTWDYAEAGGTITHVYAAAGTHTYTAYRASSTRTSDVITTATAAAAAKASSSSSGSTS